MDNNEMAMKLLGKTLGMNDEEMEIAELEALGAMTEAEETFRQAIALTEENTGLEAYVTHEGKTYVNLDLVESVLSGVAKGMLPELLKVAMQAGTDKFGEGRLSGANAVMTIVGAIVSVGRERESE